MKLMPWLHERGFVSCYADFFDLPVAVIEDAYLVATAESDQMKWDSLRGGAS